MRRFGIGLALVFAVMVLAQPALATNYYVATTGLDTASGATDSPWHSIQHAVDSGTAGDTINIAGGTYTETVYINKRLALVGATGDTTRIKPSAGGYNTCSASTVGGLILRNLVIEVGYDTSNGIYLEGCTSADIRGCSIINVFGYAMYLASCTSVNVYNNRIDSTGYDAIYMTGGTTNTIDSNVITRAKYRGINSTSDNATVSNNRITACILGGLYLNGADTGTYSGNYFNSDSCAMYVTGNSNVFSNTTIESTANHAIYLTGSSNTFTVTTCSTVKGHAIYISGASNTFTTTTCSGVNGAGLYLAAGADTNTFTTNVFTNDSYGIYLVAAAKKNTFTTNTINIQDSQGIYSAGGDRNTFTATTIANAGASGIYLVDTAVTVATATVTSAPGDGFYLAGDNATLSAITCTGCQGYGVYLYGVDTSTLATATLTNCSTALSVTGNGNTVSGVTITLMDTYGVYVSGASNTFTTTTATLCADKTVYVSGNSNTFTTTAITAGGSDGIYISSDQNTIATASCSGCQGSGLYLTGADTNTISGLTMTNDSYGVYMVGHKNSITTASISIMDTDGIYIGGTAVDSSKQNTVSGATITRCDEKALYLFGANDTFTAGNLSKSKYGGYICGDLTVFTSNSIATCTYVDIFLDAYVDSSTFTSNTLTTDSVGITMTYGNQNNTFTSNSITGADSNGINVVGDTTINNTFTSNTITSAGVYGIRLLSDRDTFASNTCTGCTKGGIYSESSDTCSFTSNILYNDSYGILLLYGYNNRLTGNTITKMDSGGIILSGDTSNTISACTISYCAKDAIRIYSSQDTVTGCSLTNNTLHGVNIQYTDTAFITDNYIYYDSVGVYVSYACKSLYVYDNIIDSMYSHGIYFAGETSVYATIDSNIITDCLDKGIISTADYGTISNNRIHGNTSDAINLTDVDTTLVRYNRLYDNGGRGLYIEDADSLAIYYNLIYNNDSYGLYLCAATGDTNTNIRIYNNTVMLDSGGIWLMDDADTLYVKNNLTYNNDNDGSALEVFLETATRRDWVIDYNLYYQTGGGEYFGTGTSTSPTRSGFSAWKSSTASDTNSVNADPQFVRP